MTLTGRIIDQSSPSQPIESFFYLVMQMNPYSLIICITFADQFSTSGSQIDEVQRQFGKKKLILHHVKFSFFFAKLSLYLVNLPST